MYFRTEIVPFPGKCGFPLHKYGGNAWIFHTGSGDFPQNRGRFSPGISSVYGKTEEALRALPPFRPKSVQLSNILRDGRAFRFSWASSPDIRR